MSFDIQMPGFRPSLRRRVSVIEERWELIARVKHEPLTARTRRWEDDEGVPFISG
jgi:hypothetical protein